MIRWIFEDRVSKENLELPSSAMVLVLEDSSTHCFSLLSANMDDEASTIWEAIRVRLREIKLKGAHREQISISILVDQKFSHSLLSLISAELKHLGIQGRSRSLANLASTLLQWDGLSKQVCLQTKKTVLQQSSTQRTRVLLVDDSPVVRKVMKVILSEIKGVEVVAEAESVEQALTLFETVHPDLVSLDMMLTDGTGLDFLKRLKCSSTRLPLRCILVTDCTPTQGGLVLEALETGASTYFQKPSLQNRAQFQDQLSELLKSWSEPVSNERKKPPSRLTQLDIHSFELIAIGSSTGGTEIVRDLIGGLPAERPPILIVQHMPGTFTGLYAERLAKQTGRNVREVRERLLLERSHAYIAAGGTHLVLEKKSNQTFAVPKSGELVNRFKPSVSTLFKSVLESGLAPKTLAIILTGMGYDGAQELLQLKLAGATTIGQSRESCAVYGMPRAAAEKGACSYVASPNDIIRSFEKSSRTRRLG